MKTTIMLSLMILLLACSCATTTSSQRLARIHSSLTDSEILAFETVRNWHGKHRNPKFAYSFDEPCEYITEPVKKHLASIIPEFRDVNDSEWFYVKIVDLAFPEPNFGYTEMITGDRMGYSILYAKVFEKTSAGWQHIDTLLLAEHGLEVLWTKFNWKAYYSDLVKKREATTQPEGKGK